MYCNIILSHAGDRIMLILILNLPIYAYRLYGHILFYRWSNTDAPGFWLYRVGDFGLNENVEPPEISSGVRPGAKKDF